MKIVRNLSSDASRAFWTRIEDSAREVAGWPAWKRAGINVAQLRAQERPTTAPVTPQTACDLPSLADAS